MTIYRRGEFEFRLARNVIVASAAVFIVAIIGPFSAGNSDLPWVVLAAAMCWLSGWVVQALVYLATGHVAGSPPHVVTVGVLGVELEPRRWDPLGALLTLMATVLAVVLLGAFYLFLDQLGHDPSKLRREPAGWSFPSFGFGRYDSPWQASAWLCWCQAALQMIPFPRSPGRFVLGSITSLGFSRFAITRQLMIFRRSISATAMLFMGVTLWSFVATQSLGGIQQIVLLGIALVLWITARSSELPQILEGYRSSSPNDQRSPGDTMFRTTLASMRRKLRTWAANRKIRKAHQQEMDEAIDARRLDEILSRLHQQGIDALSEDDRRVLQRVSANLRRQRHEES